MRYPLLISYIPILCIDVYIYIHIHTNIVCIYIYIYLMISQHAQVYTRTLLGSTPASLRNGDVIGTVAKVDQDLCRKSSGKNSYMTSLW